MRSFTLRDLFWLTLVVGMGVGWAIDRSQLAKTVRRTQTAIDNTAIVIGAQGDVIKKLSDRLRAGQPPIVAPPAEPSP